MIQLSQNVLAGMITMEAVQIIDVVSRIIHIATAITLVGGCVFTLFVVMPAAKALSESEHEQFRSRLTGRWKRFVHVGVTLFLVSGFYNYYRAMPNHQGDGLYHALLGTKILMALFIFFISAALVGRSAKLAGMRSNRQQWLRAIVLLAAVIISMSGYLKVRGVVDDRPAEETEPV